MFDKISHLSAIERLREEKLYEQVLNELSQGKKRDGLWAKALAYSEGSDEKAKALYIKYRVQSIKDELEIAEALADQEERLRQKEDEEREKAEKIYGTEDEELQKTPDSNLNPIGLMKKYGIAYENGKYLWKGKVFESYLDCLAEAQLFAASRA